MASRKKKISPSIKRMTDLRAEVEKLFSPFAVERFVWAEKVQVVSFQIEATIRLEHLKKLSRMLGTKDISFTPEAKAYGGCSDGCCSEEVEKNISFVIGNVTYPKKK